jgi:hypothetical protein
LVGFPGGQGRTGGDLTRPDVDPISGEPAALAKVLRAFAEEGVDHVQLVLDPITPATVQALAPALQLLDG